MVGFGILFVFYAMGGMGGGDVKLMGGIGAWLGTPLTVVLFLASSVVAGIYALVVVLMTGKVRQTWVHLQILWHRITAIGRHLGADDRVESEVNQSDRRGRVVPFAAMIAVGFVGILVWALLRPGH
jgi:prepilin peptidase CpaA